jgi:hypothetical protein
MKAWPQSVMGDCRSARVGPDTTRDEERKSSRNMSRTSCIQRTTTTAHCIHMKVKALKRKPNFEQEEFQENNLDFGTSTLYLASESCSKAGSLHKCSSTAGTYDFCAFDAAGDDVPSPWLGLAVGGPHTERNMRNGFANSATTSCEHQVDAEDFLHDFESGLQRVRNISLEE